jgi:hypothetical protein
MASRAKACAESDITMSTEQANAFLLGHGMVEQGWAIGQEGQADEGVALIVRGMDECRSSGSVLEFPHRGRRSPRPITQPAASTRRCRRSPKA